jgi:hypothetical protein
VDFRVPTNGALVHRADTIVLGSGCWASIRTGRIGYRLGAESIQLFPRTRLGRSLIEVSGEVCRERQMSHGIAVLIVHTDLPI